MNIQHLLNPEDPDAAIARQRRNLCQHCNYIFDHWDEVLDDEYNTRFPHCQNVFALIESASGGCYLCNQFRRNLETRGIAKTLQSVTIDTLNSGQLGYNGYVMVKSFGRIISKGGRDCWLLELRFRPPDDMQLDDEDDDDDDDDEEEEEEEEEEEDVDEKAFEDAGWPKDGGRFDQWPSQVSRDVYSCNALLIPNSNSILRNILLPPNSRAALWQAKAWLETCRRDHLRCTKQQPSLPTRLISLEGGQVRVCNSTSFAIQEQYATLSHCWGSLNILKLTKQNVRQLEQGISLTTLCKTFQDAICITLSLGLRYIWIDSLCIIQNDPEDWTREATLMSNVYSGGAINIAASSAADGSVGCFFSRDSSHVWQHTITTQVNGQIRIYDCIEDGISDECVYETPLARRAWVIQERLLAPRTLHFSSTQLFWECNTLNACEVFPDKFPASLSYGDFYLQKQPVSRLVWWEIVKLYSTCELTFERDKLVAISGIAREIANGEPGAEYIAGLWKDEIASQLCWKVRAPAEKTFQAPSWSWAAVKGTTSLANIRQSKILIRVVIVDLEGHQPFGEVPAATLTISCRDLFSTHHIHILISQPTAEDLILNWDYKTIESSGNRTYLLPVRIGMSLGDVEYVSGLLLKHTNKRQGEYFRVGHFEQPSEKFLKFQDSLLNGLETEYTGGRFQDLGDGTFSPHVKTIWLV